METIEAKNGQSNCLNVMSNELATNQAISPKINGALDDEEQLRIWLRKMDRYQFDIDYDLMDMNY